MDFDQRLTRLRAPLVEGADGAMYPDWGRPENEWDAATYWGSLQPLSSREELAAQQLTETTHISRWESGADITATDRVRYKDVDYTVDGEPGDFSDVSLYGQEAHWKARLKIIRGG